MKPESSPWINYFKFTGNIITSTLQDCNWNQNGILNMLVVYKSRWRKLQLLQNMTLNHRTWIYKQPKFDTVVCENIRYLNVIKFFKKISTFSQVSISVLYGFSESIRLKIIKSAIHQLQYTTFYIYLLKHVDKNIITTNKSMALSIQLIPNTKSNLQILNGNKFTFLGFIFLMQHKLLY